MLPIRHLIHGMMIALLAVAVPAVAQQPSQKPKPQTQQQDQNKPDQNKINSSDTHLEDALVRWLMEENLAEIELGQLAAQRASDPAVKEFAQRMVKAHTDYWKKLSKFAKEPPPDLTRSGPQTSPNQPNRQTANNTQNQTPKNENTVNRQVGFRGHKHATMEEIGKRAGELKIQMTKDLLKKYQGHEFDMAYLGDQIAAHIDMLANLKAIEESTTGEFAKVVKEGAETTQGHLERAEALSRQAQRGGHKAAGSAKTSR